MNLEKNRYDFYDSTNFQGFVIYIMTINMRKILQSYLVTPLRRQKKIFNFTVRRRHYVSPLSKVSLLSTYCHLYGEKKKR